MLTLLPTCSAPFADPNAWWLPAAVVGARIGWVQRVVTVDRLPRVTERVFALLSLVRFIDMVCSLVSGGYRPCVSEMSEHAFRITPAPYWSISSMRSTTYPLVVACSDEFRFVFQDGFELEHA